jgi:hypothetical protein
VYNTIFYMPVRYPETQSFDVFPTLHVNQLQFIISYINTYFFIYLIENTYIFIHESKSRDNASKYSNIPF